MMSQLYGKVGRVNLYFGLILKPYLYINGSGRVVSSLEAMYYH